MMSFDSHNAWLPCSYLNRGTQKQRRLREGTKRTFRNITSQKQVHADDQSAFPPWWLASLAQVTTMGLCPLLEDRKSGDRAFCHSAHTRPSMRGEDSPFLQEDHMLQPESLSLTKISTAARGARNSPKPLRRREREITRLSITSVAIED